jgi:hypothetical protein
MMNFYFDTVNRTLQLTNSLQQCQEKAAAELLKAAVDAREQNTATAQRLLTLASSQAEALKTAVVENEKAAEQVMNEAKRVVEEALEDAKKSASAGEIVNHQ